MSASVGIQLTRPACLYNSSKDAPEIAAGLAKKWDTRISAYKCDVGDNAAVHKTFQQIEKDMGHVSGLVAVRPADGEGPALTSDRIRASRS